MANQDQVLLNYIGRVVYNYYIPYQEGHEIHKSQQCVKTSDGHIKIKLGVSHNVFRVCNDVNLHGNAERLYSINVKEVSDMIIAKRWVDKSIISELNMMSNNIAHATYANSFGLGNSVTSNVENHYFSKGGCHIAHIGSLSSYSQMDFTCFDSIPNTQLQSFLTGKDHEFITSDISLKLSQMISIFFCETSRNPSSFLTIPMCLELAEKVHGLLPDEKEFRETLEKIHSVSDSYESSSQVERQKKFIDIDQQDLSETLKSEVIKDIVLSLFPLAMVRAVSASREISIQINEKLNSAGKLDALMHKYDNQPGSLIVAGQLLKIENALIKTYIKYVLSSDGLTQDESVDMYKGIIKNWFNIEDIQHQGDGVEECKLIGEGLDVIYVFSGVSDLNI